MTLGLAKLKVDTIGDTLAMKKANRLLDALGYRLVGNRSRHSVTPRQRLKGLTTLQDTGLIDMPTQVE